MRWILVLPTAVTASLIVRLSVLILLSGLHPLLQLLGPATPQMLESAICSFTFVVVGTMVSPTHKTTVGFILLFMTAVLGIGMPTHNHITNEITDTSWLVAAMFGSALGILLGVKKEVDEKKLMSTLEKLSQLDDLEEKERILQKVRSATTPYENIYHEATVMLAAVNRRTGNLEEAFRLVRETVAHIDNRNPSKGEHIHPIANDVVPLKQKALCEMARIYRALGNDSQAEVHYKRALTMTANNPLFAANLAELLEEANSFSVERERKEKIKFVQPGETASADESPAAQTEQLEDSGETIVLRQKLPNPPLP